MKLKVADPLKAGIAGPLPGDPPRNPEGKGGFGDNPPNHALAARLRASPFKAGNNANPYGCKGFKAHGVKKVSKLKRTEEQTKAALDFREIQQLARESIPKAIKELNRILESEQANDSAKIQATALLWERAYGKAVQPTINANVDADAKPSEVNDAELHSRIAETLQRIERITGRTRETLNSEERPADLRKLN